MTKDQLKKINRIAEEIAKEFIVSKEDSANPYVRVTKTNVLIYAGHEFSEELGEHVQKLYNTIELNKHDKEELITNPSSWLLGEVFYNYFIAAIPATT